MPTNDDKNNEEEKKPKPQDRIEETLLQARRIFLSEPVDNKIAEEIIKKLWFLELQDPEKPIVFFLNSPGGSVDAGFAIWDQVIMMRSPVITVVTGIAASMASILSLCAAPGKRFATPNCRIMIHQPALAGVIQGQATDLEIQAKEILKTKAHLIEIYMQQTGKTYKEIEKSIDRDTWFSAEEAKDFGLLDKIITSFDELTC